MLHEALDGTQDGGALARQTRALARALEQPHAERLLQDLDLLAERRLRHAEPVGGPAEMPLLGDREEVPEMAQEPEVDHRQVSNMASSTARAGTTRNEGQAGMLI